jgi:hypothetical protein
MHHKITSFFFRSETSDYNLTIMCLRCVIKYHNWR